jgi:hypothetical protein
MSSRDRERHAGLAPAAMVLAFLLTLGAALGAELDLVILRDGSEIECRVVELDRDRLTVETADDRLEYYSRDELRAIEFGDPAPPELRARVQVLDADDEVRLYLDGQELASPSELEAGWFDLGPHLAQGANHLTAEVTNNRNVWAYRWIVEVEGKRHTFSCGIPRKSGCREQGGSGKEHGTFPAGGLWLYVDRSIGSVEVGR